MESDPNAIVNRVSFRSEDIPLGEQTVAQVIVRWVNSQANLHEAADTYVRPNTR